MERVASKAKSTVKRIAKVPQTIGHSILSVPDTIFNNKQKRQQKRQQDQQDQQQQQQQVHHLNNDEERDELHGVICSNIIDDQMGRVAVRESQEECMREISDHLKLHLFTNTNNSDTINNTSSSYYEYEEWIAALHPDNVQVQVQVQHHNITTTSDTTVVAGGARATTTTPIIDHRFYMKDCHHRQLWNEFMLKLECRESMVVAERSNASSNIDPTTGTIRKNGYRNRTLVDTLTEEEEPNEFLTIGESCCFCP